MLAVSFRPIDSPILSKRRAELCREPRLEIGSRIAPIRVT